MNTLFKTITGTAALETDVSKDATIVSLQHSNLISQRLHIKDLALEMMIGVYESEKDKKQPVVINIELEVSPAENWQKDSLNDVISYDSIVQDIRGLANTRHYNLVETFAEKILQACLSYDQAIKATVSVEKPNAISGGLAGVTIERSKKKASR